ncbi:hypothetical protein QRQ56_39150, partial [Bradyrhizobium sp. U531]|uniref:hypothetical protein n=1 Tax=Bradyrhizobium sp. U531 TaxID=3053458 RepID=UPI003F41B5BF
HRQLVELDELHRLAPRQQLWHRFNRVLIDSEMMQFQSNTALEPEWSSTMPRSPAAYSCCQCAPSA